MSARHVVLSGILVAVASALWASQLQHTRLEAHDRVDFFKSGTDPPPPIPTQFLYQVWTRPHPNFYLKSGMDFPKFSESKGKLNIKVAE